MRDIHNTYWKELAEVDEEFLTINEVAAILKMGPMTIRRLIRSTPARPKSKTKPAVPAMPAELPSVRLNETMIPRDALLPFLNSRANGVVFHDPKAPKPVLVIDENTTIAVDPWLTDEEKARKIAEYQEKLEK